MKLKGLKFEAEALGIAALLTVLLGHLLLIGAEIATGGGLILMFISLVDYPLLTWLSHNRSSEKAYWIMYGSKIAFIAALLAFSPLICRVLARLING